MKHHRSHFGRVIRRISVGLAILAFLMFSLPSVAQAQEQPDEPGNVAPRVYLPFIGSEGVQNAAPPAQTSVLDQGLVPCANPLKLLVDTDMGVDDAVALTWLVSQDDVCVQLLGVVTVAGNTSVENATNNVLDVMATLKISHTEKIANVPVVIGAAKPQKQKLSKTGWLIHGPDGLWFQRFLKPYDLTRLPKKADKFYCDTVAVNPRATLLALGPLTNIADAYKKCPQIMATLARVVVLGGAKFGGNKTPVAEFNFWQDPEAAEFVLSRPAKLGIAPIDLVPLDTFRLATVTKSSVETLFFSPDPAANFLALPLFLYVTVQISNTDTALIPDAVAAVYAVSPTLGITPTIAITETALVKMVLEKGQARGQSVIGLTPPERVTMIADDDELSELAESASALLYDRVLYLNYIGYRLSVILAREGDNAEMLTSVPGDLLTNLVLPGLGLPALQP